MQHCAAISATAELLLNETTLKIFLLLVVQHSRVDASQHFFCNRVVSVWNSLPEYVVLSPTVGLFRSRLNRVNLDKFLFVKC